MKKGKAVLKIKGDKAYIERLQKHLHREHPSTKGKTKVVQARKRKRAEAGGLLSQFR